MKSLFADFLQNVTPPWEFKRGYTVICQLNIPNVFGMWLMLYHKNKDKHLRKSPLKT